MEKELSEIFDDFIVIVFMGGKLFGGFNLVYIGGLMQVSIVFVEQYVDGYFYLLDGSICCEVFSWCGGMYFGIVYLFGYLVDYLVLLYCFVDFNVGWYVSCNVVFQSVVSCVLGILLVLDGDLICYGMCMLGFIELVVCSFGKCLDMSDVVICWVLEQGDSLEFVDSVLYCKVFVLVESVIGKILFCVVLLGIILESLKIICKLIIVWFVKCVDECYQCCMVCVWKC